MPEEETKEPASKTLHFFKKLDLDQVKKKKIVSVNLSHALLSLLSTHDDLMTQALGSALSSSEQSDSALQT
jgi:hypothetical protein